MGQRPSRRSLLHALLPMPVLVRFHVRTTATIAGAARPGRPELVPTAVAVQEVSKRVAGGTRFTMRLPLWPLACKFGLLLVAIMVLAGVPHAAAGDHPLVGSVAPAVPTFPAAASPATDRQSSQGGQSDPGLPVRPGVSPRSPDGPLAVRQTDPLSMTGRSGAAARANPAALPAATPTPDWGPPLPLPSDPIPLGVGPFSIAIDIVKWVLQAILGFLQWILQAIVGGIMALIGPFFDPSSPYYLLSTPHLLTDQNAGVLGFIHGGTGWAALAALAVIVLLGGYNLMVRMHLGLPYHTLMEFVPRLALGAVGSVVIVAVIGGLIDLVNGLDQLGVAQIQTTFQWPDLVNNPTVFGLIFLLFALCYAVFLLLISVQLLVRLALIDLCIVLSPIALICWILPQTQRWTQFWLNAFLSALFVQPLQVLAIALGTTLLTSFSSQASVWGMIFELGIGIAAFWLAWRMPRLVESWAVRFSIGSVGSPLDLFGAGGPGSVPGGGLGGDALLGAVPGVAGGGGWAGGPGVPVGTGGGGGPGGDGIVVDGEVVSSTIVGGDLAETVPLLLLA